MRLLKRLPVLGAIAYILVGVAGGAEDVLLDATGTRVETRERPKRIVPLAPSLAELTADILGTDLSRIVGVTDYTDFPEVLKALPKVGSYTRFNLERVVALQPDLVLATTDGNSRDQIEHLKEQKLNVVVVESGSFEAIKNSFRIVARALGEEARGAELAKLFDEGILRFKKKAESRKSLKVLLQLGDEPLVVAGRDTFLNEALQTLGAINVYGNLAGSYPRPAIDDVLYRNPDSIIVMAFNDEGPFQAMAQRWKQFRTLSAAQNARIHVLRAGELLRPSLRLLQGMALLDHLIFQGT